jgi:hypothetical protein
MSFFRVLLVEEIVAELKKGISSGVIYVPPEDPDWPADGSDDFTGCLSPSYDYLIETNNKNPLDSNKTQHLRNVRWMKYNIYVSWRKLWTRLMQR